MIKRRQFLGNIAAAGLGLQFLPRLSFAATTGAGERKFILIILRGGMDGLGAVPAHADPGYAALRGELAFETNETLKLDGMFSLNLALKNLHAMFQANEASIIHAVASPYRARSHFDGQDVLESGHQKVLAGQTGWLGRLLSENGDQQQNAIALSHGIPLVLRGSRNGTSWAPSRLPGVDDDLIIRLKYLYQNDDMLKHSLEQAVMADRIASSAMMGHKKRSFRQNIAASAEHAVKFLKADSRLNMAILESYGWDTHVRQGTVKGPLANGLKDLDNGLGLIRSGLGQDWDNTVIAVVTEFGRTVRVNGNGGSDHGTAGVAFLAGGAINGGRVITDWPGLVSHNLYQGRDLYPTMDIRAVFKGILHDHLRVRPDVIERKLFQDSAKIRAMDGLIRKTVT